MNSGLALLLAFGIGVVGGLRFMTAPAVVAWAAHLGWIIFLALPWPSWGQLGPSASSLLAHWSNSLLINFPPLPPERLPSR
jgi:uncharacterized membrane protein